MHMGVIWVLCVWFGGHVQTVNWSPSFTSLEACDAWVKERKLEEVMCWPRPALVLELGDPMPTKPVPNDQIAPTPGGGGRMLMDKP